MADICNVEICQIILANTDKVSIESSTEQEPFNMGTK